MYDPFGGETIARKGQVGGVVLPACVVDVRGKDMIRMKVCMHVSMYMAINMRRSERAQGKWASAGAAMAHLPSDRSERLAMLSLVPGLLAPVCLFCE
jgi:hypothetical protein